MRKLGSGGARKGSGRKPKLGWTKVSFTLRDETIIALRAYCKMRGENLLDWLDRCVSAELKRRGANNIERDRINR
jgi:hypothetical protein